MADNEDQVRAACAEKKLKAEQEKAQADQLVMKINCQADTTVNLLKEYGIYNHVEKVDVFVECTCWKFKESSDDLALWVSHGEKEATVSSHGGTAYLGTIRECVWFLAARFKIRKPRS